MSEHTVELVCPYCNYVQKPVPYGTKEMQCPNCRVRFSVEYVVEDQVAALRKQVDALKEGHVDETKLRELTQTVTRLQEILKRDEIFRPILAVKRPMYVPADSVYELNEADLEFGIVLSVLSLFIGLMLEHFFDQIGGLLGFTTVLIGAYTVYAGRKAYKLKQLLKAQMMNVKHTVTLVPIEESDPTAP